VKFPVYPHLPLDELRKGRKGGERWIESKHNSMNEVLSETLSLARPPSLRVREGERESGREI
jgi:hypothetical protein